MEMLVLAFCLGYGSSSEARVASWNGGAQDGDWNNPANWDGEFLPGPDDDVVGGDQPFAVRINTSATVKSISLPAGSQISVVENGQSFLVKGPAKLDGVSFEVRSGGSITLPGLASFTSRNLTNASVNWVCTDAGSVLNLPGLTNFVGSDFPWRADINAADGGKISLGGNFDVTGGGMTLVATGTGSELDLPGLKRLAPNYVDLLARDGGKVSIPNLIEINGASPDRGSLWVEAVGAESVLEIAGLSKVAGAPFNITVIFNAAAGGRLVLKGDFAVNSGGVTFLSSDAHSSVEALGLRRLAPQYFACDIRNGGQVLMPSLLEWNGSGVTHEYSNWNCSGTNSVLEVPGLTNLVGNSYPYYTSFSAANGARIKLGGDFAAHEGGLILQAVDPNTVLEAPGLTALSPSALRVEAANGGHVSLPHLHDFSPATAEWSDLVFNSTGTNSVIEWSELATLAGPREIWALRWGADTGGKLKIDGEVDFREGGVDAAIDGPGSELSVLALRHLTPQSGRFSSQNGAKITLTNLKDFSGATAIDGFTFESSGTNSVLEISGLTNMIGSPFPRYAVFNATDGGRLTVQGAFGVSDGGIYWNVGPGGLLEAPGLKRLAPNAFVCNIQDGHLSLADLQEWSGTAVTHEYGSWTCAGPSGLLELPALTNLVGAPYPFLTSFAAREGATVRLGGNFKTFNGGINLVADGGGSVLEAPGLKSLRPSALSIAASAGARMSFPNLGEFSSAGNSWGYPTVTSSGAGSIVAISGLTKFEGARWPWYSALNAADGGQLTVNGAFEITSGVMGLSAVGSNSALELPALTRLAPDGLDIQARAGGRLSLPKLREFSGANFRSGSTWSAEGTNSILEMPLLVTLKLPLPPWSVGIRAASGAKVLIPGIQTLELGSIAVTADGTASVVDLRGLNRLDAFGYGGSLRAVSGGEILLPAVFGFRGVNVEGLSSWGPPRVTNDYSGLEILCAQPGVAARVEIRPAGASDAPWKVFGRVAVLTNQIALYKKLSIPPGSELRVSELQADPPEALMDRGLAGAARLIVFGVTGKTYRIESSPGITPPLWTKRQTVTLSHPFEQIDFPANNGQGFFQVVKE